MRSQVQAPV